MKTIKVIDLLNKIAKGEKVPKKIMYRDEIYEDDNMLFVYEAIEYKCESEFKEFLNDEVEIIEEKKIPEKIKSNGKEFYCDNIDSWIDKEKTSAYCEYLMNKYNDLIDYLESK